MILIAAFLLSFFPPGIFFPQMAGKALSTVDEEKRSETAPEESRVVGSS